MHAKQENDRLRKEVEALTSALKESRADAAAHLRNLETLSDKASRTDEVEAELAETHENRVVAWRKVGELEQQLRDMDVKAADLTMQRDTAVAAVEAMAIEDQAAGFPS